MKKALYILIAAVLLAACAKEQVIDTPEIQVKSGPVKINFKIASPGGETKAVKQGWEMYDKINFWFNDMYENPSATNLVIRHHDLELTMYSTWEDSYQIGELADNLMTKGELVEDYPAKFMGDADGDGIMDPEEFVYRDVYRGHVYALWVSGNNLINAIKGWTRYESHPADGHNYPFTLPASFVKPENMSPMVLSAGFTSNSGYSGGGVDYIYDPVDNTLSLVSPTDVYQKISLTWKFYTNFQVTITDLEPNHVYGLKSPQFGSNFMYIIHPDNARIQLTRMINAATEAAHFGLEERATADVYGKAVFFGQGLSNTDPADFTFTLEDITTGEERTCTKIGKTITCSDTKLAAIKLKSGNFKDPSKYVAFEDATFKAYCVANFDTDGDGDISKDEALAVTEIECINSSPTHQYQYQEVAGKRHDYMYATSLKGIEEFKNLEKLNVAGNNSIQGPLASLDLSQNTALKTVWIFNNNISALNISGCEEIENLNCSNTLITDLDLSNRTLKIVNCSNCSQLGNLKLQGSSVSNTINWEGCTEIKNFVFSGATIANWPSEMFTGMTYLTLVNLDGSNYSGTLDLSNKQYLQSVMAGNTNITDINVYNSTAIYYFDCSNSKVTLLNLNALNNLNMFSCINCTDLQSLTITECNVNSVSWTGCSNLETLNLAGSNMTTWPAGGFSIFPALKELMLYLSNYGSALDLTGNTALEKLRCQYTGITSINVSGLTALKNLSCYECNLSSLNVTGCTALKDVNASQNNLTAIAGLSSLTALTDLNFAKNKIDTIIDIHNNTALTKVTAWPQKTGYTLHQVILTPTQAENIAWWDTSHQLTDAEISAYGTTFSPTY
ncbi:MAG: hypothetical protein IK103_02785 [Bacteroidales bacterium]|nr:hypothetical protein [Bacteroidales bacterium]